MKKYLVVIACSLLAATAGLTSETTTETIQSPANIMSTSSLFLGYVILYVKDVPASLTFYQNAFGLTRRFFHDDNGKAYGELETGAARLAFASITLANEHLKQEIVTASPNQPPLGFEIALVTTDVPTAYARAVKAGATPVSEPAAKPWGCISSPSSATTPVISSSFAPRFPEESRARFPEKSRKTLFTHGLSTAPPPAMVDPC